MPPTSELDPLGQLFEGQFIHAWSLFKELKYDEANHLSLELLAEPRLGHLRRAGLHIILAHSPDDYVFHANEAVRLYETLYTDLDPDEEEPSERQLQSQERLLDYVKAVQAKALADEKTFADSKQPSEEEMSDRVQAQIDSIVDHDYLAMEADQMESKEVANRSAEATDNVTSEAVRRQVGRDENDGMFTPLRDESNGDEEPGEVAVEER